MMKFTVVVIASLVLLLFLNAGVRQLQQSEKFLEGYSQFSESTWIKLQPQSNHSDTAGVGGIVFVKLLLVDTNYKPIKNFYSSNWKTGTPLKLAPARFRGDFMDVLAGLHGGDSAVWFTKLDTLKKYYRTRNGYDEFPLEAQFDTMRFIGFIAKVDSVFTKAKVDGMMAKASSQKLTPAQQREKYKKQITDYLTDNNLNDLLPDRNGIYYKEIIPGKGLRVLPGMKVSVYYKGTFTDGRVFDTNMGDPKRSPLIFIAGKSMIPGFTDCILRMKDGGKSFFILPPEQAYGEKGAGNIPPWTPLIYEVEVKILDASTRN